MKYIKCNLDGRKVRFKLWSTQVSAYQYQLNIWYKTKPFQILGNNIIMSYIYKKELEIYRTMTDEELIEKVKDRILNDINRIESYKRNL